jgi:protein-S-isoprenylcysteine O-methyltransferase Ste14
METTAIYIAVAIYIIALHVGQNIIGRWTKVQPTRRVELASALAYRLPAALFITVPVTDSTTGPIEWVTGGALVTAGLALSLRAQYIVGHNWVFGIGIHKEHQLITTGPYHYVRHPMYSGILISSLGFCIMAMSWLFTLGWGLFALSYITRIPHEEVMLYKKFGDAYYNYKRSVWMLAPKPW